MQRLRGVRCEICNHTKPIMGKGHKRSEKTNWQFHGNLYFNFWVWFLFSATTQLLESSHSRKRIVLRWIRHAQGNIFHTLHPQQDSPSSSALPLELCERLERNMLENHRFLWYPVQHCFREFFCYETNIDSRWDFKEYTICLKWESSIKHWKEFFEKNWERWVCIVV